MAIYEIAGIRVALEPPDPYTENYIREYQVDGTCADAQLTVSPEDVELERGFQPEAHLGILNCCAVLRKMSRLILDDYNGILIHAAAILYQGKAYLFLAPSGTGKTTHIMLWKKCLGEQMQILNGDKPFLRLHAGGITVYGSPWQGKERYGINSSAPLGGVFLLNRGTENTVRRASVPEMIPGIVRATVFPEDAQGRNKVLDFVSAICEQVPTGVLHCNMEDEAVYTVQRFMDENNKKC